MELWSWGEPEHAAELRRLTVGLESEVMRGAFPPSSLPRLHAAAFPCLRAALQTLLCGLRQLHLDQRNLCRCRGDRSAQGPHTAPGGQICGPAWPV